MLQDRGSEMDWAKHPCDGPGGNRSPLSFGECKRTEGRKGSQWKDPKLHQENCKYDDKKSQFIVKMNIQYSINLYDGWRGNIGIILHCFCVLYENTD